MTFEYLSLSSVAYLLIFLTVSPIEQKFLIFMKSSLLILYDSCFASYQKYLPNPSSQRFLMISSRIFIVEVLCLGL